MKSEIQHNVQEHATPLARAGVETGEKVHVTGDVDDKAASGGCVSRLVRFLRFSDVVYTWMGSINLAAHSKMYGWMYDHPITLITLYLPSTLTLVFYRCWNALGYKIEILPRGLSLILWNGEIQFFANLREDFLRHNNHWWRALVQYWSGRKDLEPLWQNRHILKNQ